MKYSKFKEDMKSLGIKAYGLTYGLLHLGGTAISSFLTGLFIEKKGRSLLMTDTKEFLMMFPVSIGLWCIFELHNLLLHNWEYAGLPQNKFVTGFAFAIPFATILPAIYETFEFLKSRNLFNVKIRPHSYSRSRLIFEIISGIIVVLIATFSHPPIRDRCDGWGISFYLRRLIIS